jgi:hypothetical protein
MFVLCIILEHASHSLSMFANHSINMAAKNHYNLPTSILHDALKVFLPPSCKEGFLHHASRFFFSVVQAGFFSCQVFMKPSRWEQDPMNSISPGPGLSSHLLDPLQESLRKVASTPAGRHWDHRETKVLSIEPSSLRNAD